MVDPKTGRILYTVDKDADFATWANYAQVLDHGAPSASFNTENVP